VATRPETASLAQQLVEVFRNKFKLDWPDEFKLEGLQPVPNCHLMTTHPEDLQRLLVGPFTSQRFQDMPPGHRTVGFWGYGSNSYYFYFVSHEPDSRVYLRLHTGGAYTDPKVAAQEITDLLPALLFLMREVRRLKGKLILVQSAGEGEIFVHCGGPVRHLKGQLLGRADALTHVQSLIDSALQLAPGFDAAELRAQALTIAQTVYGQECRAAGNERVGMRALGSVMDIIRASGLAPNAAAYRHDVLSALAALAERHLDADGEHERARDAIRRCAEQIRSAWSRGASGGDTAAGSAADGATP
jgi:hypothetical protein